MSKAHLASAEPDEGGVISPKQPVSSHAVSDDTKRLLREERSSLSLKFLQSIIRLILFSPHHTL